MKKRSLLEVLEDIERRFPEAIYDVVPRENDIGDVVLALKADIHKLKKLGTEEAKVRVKALEGPHYWVQVDGEEIAVHNDGNPERAMLEFKAD